MTGDQQDIFNRLKTSLPGRWFTGSTPILDAVLQGAAVAFSPVYSLIQSAKSQLRMKSMSGGFLDMFAGDFLGSTLPRRSSEGDTSYLSRIISSLFRGKGTRDAIITVLTEITGNVPDVFEPRNPADTLAIGFMGLGVSGGLSSAGVHHTGFVTAYRASSANAAVAGLGYGALSEDMSLAANDNGTLQDADIYDAVNKIRPYGTGVWVNVLGSRVLSEVLGISFITSGAFKTAMLSYLRSPMEALATRVYFNTPYSYSYVGNASGTVAGLAGPVTDYRVDAYSMTDTDYLQGSAVVGTDGTWGPIYLHAGIKTARLVYIPTGAVVGEVYEDVGLVRSYWVPTDNAGYPWLKDRCYTYDQAMAIVSACSIDDQTFAEQLVSAAVGMVAANSGEVLFSVNHKSGTADDVYVRTGALAWMITAMCWFAKNYPTSSVISSVNSTIDGLITKLMTYRVTSTGLQQYAFLGGKGKYTNNIFDPTYTVTWCSTEHNLDCWFALSLAAVVRANTSYATYADQVKGALLGNFWNASLQRFNQGVTSATVVDSSDALDCHSWGALFLSAVGETTKAAVALAGVDEYATIDGGISGYKPYTVAGGYPSAGSGVWGEGTLGVVLARFACGQNQRGIADYNSLSRIAGQRGLPYSTLYNDIYELADWPSVASTAWMAISAKPKGFMDVASAGP